MPMATVTVSAAHLTEELAELMENEMYSRRLVDIAVSAVVGVRYS
jgi:hypothetical protein